MAPRGWEPYIRRLKHCIRDRLQRIHVARCRTVGDTRQLRAQLGDLASEQEFRRLDLPLQQDSVRLDLRLDLRAQSHSPSWGTRSCGTRSSNESSSDDMLAGQLLLAYGRSSDFGVAGGATLAQIQTAMLLARGVGDVVEDQWCALGDTGRR